MESFTANLRKRAAELGISNAEAGRRAGLSERRYSNYVSGAREPDLATLVRIAQALETSPDALLGFAEASDPAPRSLLLDRLRSAGRAMDDASLRVFVTQAEAVAHLRPEAG